MLQLLILGVGVVLGLYLILRGFANADPRFLARVVRGTALTAGAGFLLFMIVTGRVGVLLSLLPFVVAPFLYWRGLRRRVQAEQGPAPGQESEVRTPFLHMTLDHDSGTMTGHVVDGPYAGQRLDRLALDELRRLYADYRRTDAQSAALLEAYLDRAFPEGWRDAQTGAAGAGGGGSASGEAMTRDEAYRILGLEPGADAEAIKAAHRRLMLKLHPDQGGSTYLAAKINQAKDLLLGS